MQAIICTNVGRRMKLNDVLTSIGISQQQLYRIRHAKRLPSFGAFARLCEVLEMDSTDVVDLMVGLMYQDMELVDVVLRKYIHNLKPLNADALNRGWEKESGKNRVQRWVNAD